MTYSTCHRCHADLPPYDEGTLIYCPHCGAPQITLSEELQTQEQVDDATQAGAVPAKSVDARVVLWRGAIRCAALAAAISAALAVCARFFPPIALLSFLWIVSSPVVVLGLFQSRFPRAAITTAFGARLGLLTGIGVAASLSIVNTTILVIDRRLHLLNDFDASITKMFEQLRAQLATQPGGDPTGLSQRLLQPEFRAGWLLAFIGIAIVFLLALTTVGGAFAGFLRSRRRA